MLNRTQPIAPDDYSGLPMLTIVADSGSSMGFEGYLAFDISELSNGNPWSASEVINTLPVFQNPVSYDDSWNPIGGLTVDEMKERARQAAAALGMTVDSVFTNPTEEMIQRQKEKDPTAPTPTPYEAVAICGDVTIRVLPDGQTRIFFDDAVPLPGQYSLTYDNTTAQQAHDVVQYLLEQYPAVIDMISPALDIVGHYTYYAQIGFSFSAFENSGSITERIIGYNFNRVRFSPNDDGELWIIDRYNWDLSQKIGDYPIITETEARMLLLNNHYITNVPEALPGEEYIANVELVYRTGWHDAVFMPYYLFLVEMPSMQMNNGLKTFGAFYVPAVSGEFLENMPLWDGVFN